MFVTKRAVGTTSRRILESSTGSLPLSNGSRACKSARPFQMESLNSTQEEDSYQEVEK
jgi:hypothetical protein